MDFGCWFLGEEDVRDIAAGCPALRELRLSMCVFSACAGISSFARLQSPLAALRLSVDQFSDEGTAAVAQLSRLQVLHVHLQDICSVTDRGLQELTALKGLTELSLRGWRGLGDALQVEINRPRGFVLQSPTEVSRLWCGGVLDVCSHSM